MANFNLKSIFTADTKDLKQGAKEAKQAVQDFDDATTSALDQVTGLFGASMKEINTTLSTVRGGFMTFSSSLSKSVQGASLFSKAMGVVKVALASTGIGALVVALGSLVAYFTKSQEGANILGKVMGQVGQAFKTVTDYAIKLGEKIVNAFKNPAQAARNFWKILTNKEERQKLSESLGNIGDDFVNRQKERLALTERQQALEKKQIEWTIEKAKIQTEIEQQREIAEDKVNKTAQERLNATLKAQELTRKLYAQETAFAQEKLDILQIENSLSESMNVDLQAEADLEAAIIGLEGQRASRMKELLTKQAELTKQVVKEREEREKMERLAAMKVKDKLQPLDFSGVIKDVKVTTELTPEFNPKPLEKGVQEAEGYLIDFQKIATDFSNTISDAFASMIEGLVTGNFSLQDIFGTILGFLSESLKAIGKALIAYGTAMDAFKKAFKNPWVAIAAGAALVAAGSVLSGLIKKMSSGSESSASPSATFAAATVGGGGTLDLRNATSFSRGAQEIKVTGRLIGEGRQIVAVIENEYKRKGLTT